MSHSCNKCKSLPKCGCADTALTTPISCNPPLCPVPEPCAETFSTDCILYMGDGIVELGIKKGDRITEILQRLALTLTNPACILPGQPCQSALNIKSTAKTQNTISVSWSAVTQAVSYQVEYKEVSSLIWLINPNVGLVTNDVIGLLLPNTSYHIRVNTFCTMPDSCYSVTILVTTLTT